MALDADGRPIEHDKTKSPICRRVACGKFEAPPNDTREPDQIQREKPGIWPASWWPVFQKYRMCVATGLAPRAGGLNDQDWFEMRVFTAIKFAEDVAKQMGQRDIVAKAGPIAGLLAMSMMK